MTGENNTYSREVAKRVTAGELRLANKSFKEDDGDMAPKYVLLPSGDKANRVLFAGTLTEKNNSGGDYWNSKVVDGGDRFTVGAGKYQADARSFIQNVDPPEFVIGVGKVDTYEPEDDDVTVVSVRAENMRAVDEDARNHAIKEAIAHTLNRLNDEESEYNQEALEHYGENTRDELRRKLEKTEESMN